MRDEAERLVAEAAEEVDQFREEIAAARSAKRKAEKQAQREKRDQTAEKYVEISISVLCESL